MDTIILEGGMHRVQGFCIEKSSPFDILGTSDTGYLITCQYCPLPRLGGIVLPVRLDPIPSICRKDTR
ncbi:hypothetical protein KQ880_15675, partial [Listeria monocytogenes]|nr:hypothetical protein [Listeria monocytogenes]